MNHTARPTIENSWILLCDIQEKFISKIYNMESVMYVAKRMNQIAKAFDIPMLITEQVPKNLGHIANDLKADLPTNHKLFEKSRFSMITPEVLKELKSQPKRKNIILYGIEAHICVLQTALEAIENGFGVYLVIDGVSSQRELDRSVGLKRLEQSDVVFTTVEQLIFELLRDQKHRKFKSILPLLKVPRPTQFPKL